MNCFVFRQNNSGGRFHGPAAKVIIEADTRAQAVERARELISLCGDSGRYADYDDCGCCPCCGHRWSQPYDDEPESGTDVAEYIGDDPEHWGLTNAVLRRADGEVIVGDSDAAHARILSILRKPVAA